MEKIKNRQTNFELLRIVAILMIITLHYLSNLVGGPLDILKRGDTNYYIGNLFKSLSIVSVNLFIIMMGYFSVNQKKVKISKAIRLAMLGYFYGGIIYIISIFLGKSSFSLGELLQRINPFLRGEYWFIITYIILYLLSPYINILLNNINKKMHISLIVVMGFFFQIWPSFFKHAPNNDKGYGIISFFILYIIGSYIKRYYKINKSIWIYLSVYIACTSITFIFSILNTYIYAWALNFIFNVIGSISLFLAFCKININSSFIKYLATFTFPIYLLHFNELLLGYMKPILKIENFYYSKNFVINMIISVVVLYCVSFMFEFIRRKLIALFKCFIPKKIQHIYSNFEKMIDDLYNNILNNDIEKENYNYISKFNI